MEETNRSRQMMREQRSVTGFHRKIVFSPPSFRAGGMEGANVRFANALASYWLDTTILVLEITGPWRASMEGEVEVLDYRMKRASRSLWPVCKFLIKMSPDNSVSHLVQLNLISAVAQFISRSKIFLYEHYANLSGVTRVRDFTGRLLFFMVRIFYNKGGSHPDGFQAHLPKPDYRG